MHFYILIIELDLRIAGIYPAVYGRLKFVITKLGTQSAMKAGLMKIILLRANHLDSRMKGRWKKALR